MPEPPRLRALRRLVTVLTATMILGLLTIVVLLVIKIAQPTPAPLPLPPEISLPDGEVATAITQGRDWFAIVSVDRDGIERIHIYNADGTLRQDIDITP